MSIDPNLYVTSLVQPAVKVTPLGDALKVKISWDAQPASGGYRVYAGFDPFHIRSLISGSALLSANTLEFTFDPPVTPPTQVMYFWVATVTGSTVTFLDEYGSYHLRSEQYAQFTVDPYSDTTKELICGDDQLYFVEEMRRRSKAILEDAGNEEADLFIKQWTGLPDPTTQSELGLDPNYQGMSRDDRTYGVGFYPGFFPATTIKLRWGGLPGSQFDYQTSGMRPLLDNEAWTLWDPLMHENDLIVRKSTGLRYVVKGIAYSNYRGVPLTQRLTLELVNPTSPLQKVNDADVVEKWKTIDGIGYMRIGFNALPDDNGNPTDYLLFR